MTAEARTDKPPRVTVALPVFNGGALVVQAVRSVLAQSYPHIELIVLDDGSSDGAAERLADLNDPRVVLVRDGRNVGLSARLNQAVNMAKGEYFARMDHDDLCHPERFAEQVRFLDQHPEVDLLATQCVLIDESSAVVGLLPSATAHDAICRRPWQGFYMAHPTWMGRIAWFRANPYPDPAPYCCEDQELLLSAFPASRYHTLPQRLLAYRIRTRTPLRKLVRTRLAMMAMQRRYFFRRREWRNAALSCVIGLARIAHDAGEALRHSVTQAPRVRWAEKPPAEELRAWETLIAAMSAPLPSTNDEVHHGSR